MKLDKDKITFESGATMIGQWTILGQSDRKHYYLCQCSCGTKKEVYFYSLKSSASKSCGCRGEIWKRGFKKERRAWSLMKYRCLAPTSPDYSNYGGRGIMVCERWLSLKNFVEDMGKAPFIDATVERIDVNKNYEPNNCIWLEAKKQALNTRRTRWLDFNGERIRLGDIPNKFGIKYTTIKQRLSRGWPIETALLTKVAAK